MALAGLPGWLGSLVNVVALGDFVASFSRLHLQSERVWAITVWFDRFVFFPTVAARYAALAACAVWALAHSVRREVAI